MSERVFKFFLSELQIVRIICMRGGCGGAVELPINKLYKAGSAKCPICEESLNPTPHASTNAFGKLKQAIEEAVQAKDTFAIEFVLPDQSQKKEN